MLRGMIGLNDGEGSTSVASVAVGGDLSGSTASSVVDSVGGKTAAEVAAGVDAGVDLFLPPYAAFSDIVGFVPGFLTRGDEAAGDLRDAAADALLAATGTALYQRYRAGRRGVAVTANATGWSAAILDFANTNTIFGGWIGVDDAVAAQRTMLGRITTDAGIYARMGVRASNEGGGADNKAFVEITDGAAHYGQVIANKVVTDGVPRLWLAHIDRTMTTLRFWICGLGESPVTGTADITAVGTLTGGTTPKFQVGFAASVQNGDDSWYGGSLVRINADMTGVDLIGDTGTALLAYANRGA